MPYEGNVTNPGFEIDLSDWTKTDADASTTWTRDTGTTNGGSAGSSKLVNTAAGADDFISQFFSIQGNRSPLLVTAWVNVTAFTAAATGNRGFVIVDAGSLFSDDITAATAGWVLKQHVYVPKAGSTSIQIRLYAPQGTTFWDDIAAREYGPKPLQPYLPMIASPSGIVVPVLPYPQVDPVSTGFTNLNLGTALEDDLAQALARSKNRIIGIVAETDLPQPMISSKSRTLGIALETDAAQLLTRTKNRTLGIVNETDLAQALTRSKNRVLGIVQETDLAQSFARTKAKTLGIASETDLAQALSRSKRRLLGIATETDLALALSHAGATATRKLKMLMGIGR